MMKRFLAALLLVLAGCDQDTFIDPFVDQDRPFTVYGVLRATDQDHFVRVIPVRRSPEVIENERSGEAFLDAIVESIDLASGQRLRWTPELRRLEDGTFGHVFTVRFDPRPGARYRLEVIRSDGETTSAETQIPAASSAGRVEPGPLRGQAGTYEQDIVLRGSGQPAGIEMVYILSSPLDPARTQRRFPVPYGLRGTTVGDGWQFTATLSSDRPALLPLIEATYSEQALEGRRLGTLSDVSLVSLSARVLSVDPAWNPPADPLDFDALAQPGAATNVDNGYGLWLGVNSQQFDWDAPAGLPSVLPDW